MTSFERSLFPFVHKYNVVKFLCRFKMVFTRLIKPICAPPASLGITCAKRCLLNNPSGGLISNGRFSPIKESQKSVSKSTVSAFSLWLILLCYIVAYPIKRLCSVISATFSLTLDPASFELQSECPNCTGRPVPCDGAVVILSSACYRPT